MTAPDKDGLAQGPTATETEPEELIRVTRHVGTASDRVSAGVAR